MTMKIMTDGASQKEGGRVGGRLGSGGGHRARGRESFKWFHLTVSLGTPSSFRLFFEERRQATAFPRQGFTLHFRRAHVDDKKDDSTLTALAGKTPRGRINRCNSSDRMRVRHDKKLLTHKTAAKGWAVKKRMRENNGSSRWIGVTRVQSLRSNHARKSARHCYAKNQSQTS